jgi:hypothetical protein
MKMCGQLHIPVAVPAKNEPSGGCVGLEAGIHALEKRNVSVPAVNRTPIKNV